MGFIRGPPHKTKARAEKKKYCRVWGPDTRQHPLLPAASGLPHPVASEKHGSVLGIQFLKGVTVAERSLQGKPMSNDEEQLVC